MAMSKDALRFLIAIAIYCIASNIEFMLDVMPLL